MMVASTSRPLVRHQSALGQKHANVAKQLLGQAVGFQQVPKLQDRRLIGHRIVHQVDACKAPHRLRIDEHLLHGWIGQVEPLLQQVNAQHPLQRHRAPAQSSLRIVRLDQGGPVRPRYYAVHLVEKLLAPRSLLRVVFEIGKGALLHCSFPKFGGATMPSNCGT